MQKREQYLVNDEKGFVIRRKNALSMLKDLKIKVHSDPVR